MSECGPEGGRVSIGEGVASKVAKPPPILIALVAPVSYSLKKIDATWGWPQTEIFFFFPVYHSYSEDQESAPLLSACLLTFWKRLAAIGPFTPSSPPCSGTKDSNPSQGMPPIGTLA